MKLLISKPYARIGKEYLCQGAGSGTDILGIDEQVKLQVRLSTDT